MGLEDVLPRAMMPATAAKNAKTFRMRHPLDVMAIRLVFCAIDLNILQLVSEPHQNYRQIYALCNSRLPSRYALPSFGGQALNASPESRAPNLSLICDPWPLSSFRRRPVDVLDDENINRPARRLQLQSKLFL